MKTLIAALLLSLATVASAQQISYGPITPLPPGGKFVYADQYTYPGIFRLAQQSNTPTTILLNYNVRHRNYGACYSMFNRPTWASQYRSQFRYVPPQVEQPLQCSPILLDLREPPNPTWIENTHVRPKVVE